MVEVVIKVVVEHKFVADAPTGCLCDNDCGRPIIGEPIEDDGEQYCFCSRSCLYQFNIRRNGYP